MLENVLRVIVSTPTDQAFASKCGWH